MQAGRAVVARALQYRALFLLCWVALSYDQPTCNGQNRGLDIDSATLQTDTLQEGALFYHTWRGQTQLPAGVYIGSISTPCNCARPELETGRLLPGRVLPIRIRFDTEGQTGPFDKSFLVYDSLGKPLHRLRLRGFVKPAPVRSFSHTIRYGYDEINNASLAKWVADTLSILVNRQANVGGTVAAATLLNRLDSIVVVTMASASHVPTKRFATNSQLAKTRGEDAAAQLKKMLETVFGIGPAKVRAVVKTQVAGPQFSPKEKASTYIPYQFTTLHMVWYVHSGG
jgi:hypothetical protein